MLLAINIILPSATVPAPSDQALGKLSVVPEELVAFPDHNDLPVAAGLVQDHSIVHQRLVKVEGLPNSI